MKHIFVTIVVFLYAVSSFSQSADIVKKKYTHGYFNAQDTAAGYSEAVMVDNVIYLSGYLSRGTIAEQLQSLYSELGKILTAHGASFQNVVKETLYTTDIEAVKANNTVRKAFYNGDYPAATWVQISRLFSPRKDAQIEVELIAHLPAVDAK